MKVHLVLAATLLFLITLAYVFVPELEGITMLAGATFTILTVKDAATT